MLTSTKFCSVMVWAFSVDRGQDGDGGVANDGSGAGDDAYPGRCSSALQCEKENDII